MSRRTRCLLAATAILAGLVVAAPAAQAEPSISFKCTPAPQDCSGWFRTNVTIDWTVLPTGTDGATILDGCRDNTYVADTPAGGTTELCYAEDGGVERSVQLRIRRDATAPVVTGGSPARAADSNGWYNHDVLLTFKGTDQTSAGRRGCTSRSHRRHGRASRR